MVACEKRRGKMRFQSNRMCRDEGVETKSKADSVVIVERVGVMENAKAQFESLMFWQHWAQASVKTAEGNGSILGY